MSQEQASAVCLMVGTFLLVWESVFIRANRNDGFCGWYRRVVPSFGWSALVVSAAFMLAHVY